MRAAATIEAMAPERPPGGWRIRRLRVVGIAFVALIVAFSLFVLVPGAVDVGEYSVTIGPLRMPTGVAVFATAVVLTVSGWIWLAGIFRGEGEPPPWRYRDR